MRGDIAQNSVCTLVLFLQVFVHMTNMWCGSWDVLFIFQLLDPIKVGFIQLFGRICIPISVYTDNSSLGVEEYIANF